MTFSFDGPMRGPGMNTPQEHAAGAEQSLSHKRDEAANAPSIEGSGSAPTLSPMLTAVKRCTALPDGRPGRWTHRVLGNFLARRGHTLYCAAAPDGVATYFTKHRGRIKQHDTIDDLCAFVDATPVFRGAT